MRSNQDAARKAVAVPVDERCGVDGSAVALSPGSPWETVTKIWEELYEKNVLAVLWGFGLWGDRAADERLMTLSQKNLKWVCHSQVTCR